MSQISPALARSRTFDTDISGADTSSDRIVGFYDAATLDYLHWSRGLNMHLGYFRWGMNPFDREAMLEQMNVAVADRLGFGPDDYLVLLDLGCGAGATTRAVAKRFPQALIKGVTLAASQIPLAERLNEQSGLHRQIEITPANYCALPFSDGSVDGVWAVESACYAAGGPAKTELVREIKRVLRPGGQFVIADCFVKQPERPFGRLGRRCYEAMCHNWSVPELASLEKMVAELERQRFVELKVEDISYQVAPSLAHIPYSVASFLVKQFLAGKPMDPSSRSNLLASLLAIPVGLNRRKISYCIVSGRA
jgi:ubiquinone/menaquinone biosynthesis C-methylase UbiE